MWQILSLVTVITIGTAAAADVIDVAAYAFCLSFAMTFDIYGTRDQFGSYVTW